MTGEAKTTAVARKAFGWGGSMTAVRLVCSFLSIKITAVYLGPTGLALVAQLTNFVSLFQSMLGQGLVTGVVRLSSEYSSNIGRRNLLLSTAFRMSLMLSVPLILILLALSPLISGWLLSDRSYYLIIGVCGIAVTAGIFSDVLQGALSATKEIGLIAKSTILATILSLIVFSTFSYFWRIPGGLWASVVISVTSASATIFFFHRYSVNVKLKDFIGKFSREECKKILTFYPMLIINGALPPLVLIIVRDTLASSTSLHVAGLWQATWRLSEVYQSIIISSITLYFMQSIGERAGNLAAMRSQISRTFWFATGATVIFAAGIFIVRKLVVHIIFNATFIEVANLLPVQLLGDVFKMGSWVLGMALVATFRTAWFVSGTIFASIIFVVASKLLIPSIGVQGVLWAYVLTYAAQLPIFLFALRKILLVSHPQPALQ